MAHSQSSHMNIHQMHWAQEAREYVARMEREGRKKLADENCAKFHQALGALKIACPTTWEAWYDDDRNIPWELRWSDTKLIDELVRRMNEYASHAIHGSTATDGAH